MRLRWVLGGIAVAVLAALGFGAWYVFGDNAPAKPKLSASATTLAGGGATPDGSWKVAPGENVYVGYRMTEVFAGDTIHKTAAGRTPAVAGTLTINGGVVTATDVIAQMQQLKSNRGTRDNYIHTNGIESDRFPTAEFALTKPITLPANVQKGVTLHLPATGRLTLHGVTKTVAVELEARWDGGAIEVVAKDIPIVLADYGIEPPNTGVVTVDDHGSFELSLVFVPAPA